MTLRHPRRAEERSRHSPDAGCRRRGRAGARRRRHDRRADLPGHGHRRQRAASRRRIFRRAQATAATGGGVVLNFEGADLREVIRNILGDILGESYTIDPAVGGQVTIRTTTGIPREALPATLEMLLRMNGATMVKEGGLYKIVPQAAAVRGNVTPQLGNSQSRAAAGILGADRSAALRRRERDAAAPRAVRARRAGGARRRAAQPDDPLGHRARAAAPDRRDRHVRHRLDDRHVGGRVRAAERRREDGDAGARQACSAIATRARWPASCASSRSSA